MEPRRSSILKAQWQWQSNSRPWPYQNQDKVEWTAYDIHTNYLIEKAYAASKKEVDIGDYTVLIEDRVQISKKDNNKQRRVRRIEDGLLQKEENDKGREERFVKQGKFRTWNKTFGSLQDFINFFSSRGDEIYGFTRLFYELEANWDAKVFNDEIVPRLIADIKRESRKYPRNKKEGEYLELLERQFDNLVAFYESILRAYTINGFLFNSMNAYLREEDWIQLDDIMNYVFCLCKAFCSQNMISIYNKDKKITVYRGAALDEDSLVFYRENLQRNFSWNATTSTSTDIEIAKNFIYINLELDKKNPVLFIIDIPLNNDTSLNPNWLDIASFSKFPHEKEIVFAPGSVYKLIKYLPETPKTAAEVHLELITEVKDLARQGQMMSGVMLSHVRQQKCLRIPYLEGRDLSRLMLLMKGNTYLEELEFVTCKFNEKSTKILKDVLPSLPNLKRLCFDLVNKYDNKEFFSILLNAEIKVEILEIKEQAFEKEDIHFFRKIIKDLPLCKTLILMKSVANFWDAKLMIKEMTEKGFQHRWFTTSDFDICIFDKKDLGKNLEVLNQVDQEEMIKNEEKKESEKRLENYFSCLAKGQQDMDTENWLKESGKEHASVALYLGDTATFEGLLNWACQGLIYLTSLTHLTLDFHDCLMDESLKSLWSQGIRNLILLNHLNLNFQVGTTDQGLNYMCSQGLQSFSSLTCLALTLFSPKITNEGLKDLCSKGLRHLTTSLTSLTLEIHNFCSIKDEGFKILCSKGLKFLSYLTSLTLNLSWCLEITDNGLKNLCSEGLINLTSLTSLDLNFSFLEITDEALKDLCSEGLTHLTCLTSLTLNLSCCKKITDKGLKNLSHERLKHLASLTSLDLNLSETKITGEGLSFLCSEGLRHLTDLNLLTLNFGNCFGITKKDLKDLSCKGLKHLPSLVSLNLNFSSICITDEAFKGLFCEGFLHLTSLTSLTLNFDCSKITDEGIHFFKYHPQSLPPAIMPLFYRSEKGCLTFLRNPVVPRIWQKKNTGLSPKTNDNEKFDRKIHKSQLSALKYDTLLTSLTLKFNWENSLTDKETKELCFGRLRSLVSLTSLTLEFYECGNTDDDALKYLCSEGLKYLTSLTSLTLKFVECDITDDGLKYLCSEGLKYLTSLASLELKFIWINITDEGLKSLCSKELEHLNACLTSLALYFTGCDITDSGMYTLCSERLQHLTSLTSLTLHFWSCDSITDEGLKNLCSERLKNLKSLDFTLARCPGVTDRGANVLCSKGFKHFAATLTSLTLNLSDCDVITGEGWRNLCSKELEHFISLKSLDLKFPSSISDEVVQSFCSGQPKYLTSLTSLVLNFDYSKRVTDRGMNILCYKLLKHLTSLTSLNLQLFGCQQITNEKSKRLSFKGLKHLSTCLKSLSFGFFNSKITDKGLENLCTGVLRYLTSLISLTIGSFSSETTNQGMKSLSCKGFKHLNSLTSLTLNLSGTQITDEGLKNLGSEGLKYLTSLESFTLRFSHPEIPFDKEETLRYSKITYKGLMDLCYEVSKQLKNLKSLTLSFSHGSLTEIELGELCSEGLKYLTYLTILTLDFPHDHITDEGLKILCMKGLKYLISLESLTLNLSRNKITDEGLNTLCSKGLKPLNSLTSLALDLSCNEKITQLGITNLHSFLQYYCYSLVQSE